MNSENLSEITEWLNTQSSTIQFGEIAITCIMHEGKLKRVIKTVTESELKN